MTRSGLLVFHRLVRYQRGNLLTLECGRVLKAKFTAFNESWEEVRVGGALLLGFL